MNRSTRVNALLSAAAAVIFTASAFGAAPVYTYKVIAKYPHSTSSYTEGLFYLDGLFYESTGLKGHSAIMAIQPDTGKPLHQYNLPQQYFGEGIVDWGPNISAGPGRLTSASSTIAPPSASSAPSTTQARAGASPAPPKNSSPATAVPPSPSATRRPFKETRHLIVSDGPTLIDQLNELEYIHGEIYANIWHSDQIARISPEDGHVIAWIDLAGILPPNQKINAESVLNGIAYDAKRDRLFVTGKQWPFIFEIKMLPKSK
jgi:glutaminyl-peptide cyclotransferase